MSLRNGRLRIPQQFSAICWYQSLKPQILLGLPNVDPLAKSASQGLTAMQLAEEHKADAFLGCRHGDRWEKGWLSFLSVNSPCHGLLNFAKVHPAVEIPGGCPGAPAGSQVF